jgi:lipooligosaccharide transport system permease protein
MVVSSLAPSILGRADASARRSGAVTGRNITALRSLYWLLIASGFFEPILYLLSIGYGLATVVGRIQLGDGHSVSYAEFVAPAMLASSAMSGALAESTMNFFGKMKFSKQYDAVLATPVRPMEVALGELWWAIARGAMYSAAFVIIMVAIGLTDVRGAIGAFLTTLLVGFAFGCAGMAVTTFMNSWQDFDLVVTIQVALFLFSATFVPLGALSPHWLRWVVEVSPLYHSVVIVREFTLGTLDWEVLGHFAYLVVMAAVGLTVASKRMTSLLLK